MKKYVVRLAGAVRGESITVECDQVQNWANEWVDFYKNATCAHESAALVYTVRKDRVIDITEVRS